MYESFYGLKEKPFSLLPDPAYLYLSRQHEMAITLLQYSLENQAGFCVISGKAGTGKTTLLRRLLNQVGDDVSVGLISNTHHSFGELMRWILHAFGLEGAGLSRAAMHQFFLDYLIAQYAKNRRTMLIIDEAQNMAADALEELRMLSNINSEKDLLLQVILVGQPPLRDILRRPELEQFAQRIAVDYHLDSLNREETGAYIRHRIMIAGGEHELFTEDATDAVYDYCGGNPRLINLLCDLSLVYAYASQAAVVTGELVEQVVTEREKYGALPLFVSNGKPRARLDASAAVLQAVTTATAPAVPKATSLKAATNARGAIPAETRIKTTRLTPSVSVPDSDRAGQILQSIPTTGNTVAAQAGAVDISPAKGTQKSGTESITMAGTTMAIIRHGTGMSAGNVAEAATRVEKSVAMRSHGGKSAMRTDSTMTEKTSSTNAKVDSASPREPDDLPVVSSPAGDVRYSVAQSGRARLNGIRSTKSSAVSGLNASHQTRPVSGPRQYIPAVVVVGLFLAAPFAWHFVQRASVGIHAAPVNASPPSVIVASPVTVAAPVQVTTSGEPSDAASSPRQISAVNKQEPEVASVQKDLEEKARLKSVERQRNAALARAKAAEREREALRKARLAREQALATEHEAALARERERTDQLAQAAEKVRQEARAAEAARLAAAQAAQAAQAKKPEPVPPASQPKVSIDKPVSRPDVPGARLQKADAEAGNGKNADEPAPFTANPCKGPSARFLSTCE